MYTVYGIEHLERLLTGQLITWVRWAFYSIKFEDFAFEALMMFSMFLFTGRPIISISAADQNHYVFICLPAVALLFTAS